MNKISVISKTLMGIFFAYLIWIPYTYFYAWIVLKYPINKPFGFSIGNIMHPAVKMDIPNLFTMKAPLLWKLAYSFETFVIFVLYMMMTIGLIRLFRCYSKQVIYEFKCLRLIKQIGYYLLFIYIIRLLCPVINTYILSMSFQKTLSAFYFDMDEAIQLVMSLLTIIVFWIMHENKKIHDEQQLTI